MTRHLIKFLHKIYKKFYLKKKKKIMLLCVLHNIIYSTLTPKNYKIFHFCTLFLAIFYFI